MPATSSLKHLLRELHGRSLWQVLLIYAGASWLILQVIEVLMEGMGLPGWVFPAAIALLLAGLPIVLATAFVQEGGPELRSTDPTLHPELERDPGLVTAGDEDRDSEGPAGQTWAEKIRSWFTWRNAIVGGVLAFALLGVGVTGYMVMRLTGVGPVGTLIAEGALEEREPIVLAEFEGPSTDPELGSLVTQALRIDLHESPVVTVADPARISRALERMGREPSTPLDEALAREVALREGLAAVLAGQVSALGGRYHVSARLIRPDDGTQLVGVQTEAADSTAILDAIDELSSKLRERIGESLSSVRASEPLARVTTSSLEALRKYSQAVDAIIAYDDEQALILLREAVAVDSTFAIAWRQLGVVHWNRRERSEVEPALEQAYELRDRLSDRERYHTEGIYHQVVTENLDRAAAAYRSLLSRYPEDTRALNNLALILVEQGNEAQAESLNLRAIETRETGLTAYNNLLDLRLEAGRVEGADSVLRWFAEAHPEHPLPHWWRSGIAYRQRNYGAAEAALKTFLDATAGQRESQIQGRLNRMYLLAALGRFEEAEQVLEEAERRLSEAGRTGEALEHAVQFAIVDLKVLGDTSGAVERVDEARRHHPLDDIPAADRPYTELMAFAALRGNGDRVRELREHENRASATDTAGTSEPELPPIMAGLLARAEGRWSRVRELLAPELREDRCGRICLPVLGKAYAATASPDSAVVAYERFLDQETFEGGAQGYLTDAWWRVTTHEALADLYQDRGDPEAAAEQYRQLIELWKDCDPELEARVEAAREGLERMGAGAPAQVTAPG